MSGRDAARPGGATDLTLYAHPFSSYCQKVLVAHLLAYRRRLLARPSFARGGRGAAIPAVVSARRA